MMNLLPRLHLHPERVILFCVTLLCGFGLVMVYSSSAVLGIALRHSSAHFFESQLVKLIAGSVVLLCFWRLDYHYLKGRVARAALITIFVSLTILAIQHQITGKVCRWHIFAGQTLQSSEFARVVLVAFLASYISRRKADRSNAKVYLIPGVVTLGMVGLVANQPNLSMALLILMLAVGVVYIAGVPIRWLSAGLLGGMTIALLGLRLYQATRFREFWEWLTGERTIYQLEQSITAVGSAGLIGPGPGNGLQKYFFLPFPHTDFILGIVGEETGLVGITTLFAAYALLIVMGITAARRAPDRFGALLAAGLTLNLAMNLLLHGAVNFGLVPVTGVPLPFLSSGGSSLVANLAAIGILLSVARRSVEARARDWSTIGGFTR